MKVHAALARSLADHGVTTLFGLIGDANLFMVDAYTRDPRTTYVGATHEAGAVLMAGGFASVTNDVGVATVTQGPGLTNTVTALIEGVRNRFPVVLVAGDTPTLDKHHFHNIDQREVVACTGAGFEQVRSPETAVADLATALRRARAQRIPIVLNVPSDYQWRDVEYNHLAPDPEAHQSVAPDPRALDRAVGIIASAKRPIVLAGVGAADPLARAAVVRFASRIGAPLATTLKGKGLFRGDAYDLGVFGTLSNPVCVDAILESDCVIAFGASLNKHTTSNGRYLGGKSVVHCDVSPANIGRYYRVDAPIVGDAGVAADTMIEWLDEAEIEPSSFRSDDLAASISAYSPADFQDLSNEDTVDIRTALIALDRACPAQRLLVTDGGRFWYQAMTYVNPPDPRSLVVPISFGSIGLGVGTAIGASFAARDRPTLVVTGDGGFMLGGLMEFNTAVRNDADLIVAVCNDGSYGAEHVQFSSRGMDPGISMFEWPSLASIATSLGGHGVTVRNVADLEAMSDAIDGRRGPLVIDIKIDPTHVPNDDSHGLSAPAPALR